MLEESLSDGLTTRKGIPQLFRPEGSYASAAGAFGGMPKVSFVWLAKLAQ